MYHLCIRGFVRRLPPVADGSNAPWRSSFQSYRRLSVLGNFFRQEVPVDQTQVKVSLFDKESALQDFSTSLNALLSSHDVSFNAIVVFLRKAAFPPDESLPPLFSYSTGSIIRLFDALTYLLQIDDRGSYRSLIDLVAQELKERQVLELDECNLEHLQKCIRCLSRIKDRSKNVKLLVHRINKEIRSKTKLLLQKGQFTYVIGSLAHIVHPSVIDTVVHTYCCERGLLSPRDLSNVPKLLAKLKITNEKVIESIIEHATNHPSEAFNNDVKLACNFMQQVAEMPYMDNADGHLTERPYKRMTSMILPRIEEYSKEDSIFILHSIPSSVHLSPNARGHSREIVDAVLVKLGLVVMGKGNIELHKDIANAIKTLDDRTLVAVADAITRVGTLNTDMSGSSIELQKLILGKVSSYPVIEKPSIARFLESILSEINIRIGALMKERTHNDASTNVAFLDSKAYCPLIRLVTRYSRLGPDSSKDKMEPILTFFETELSRKSIEKPEEVVLDLLKEIVPLDPVLRFKLLQSIYSLLQKNEGRKGWALRMLRKTLYLTPPKLGKDVDDTIAIKFVKDLAEHIIESSTRMLSIGAITRNEYDETMAYVLLVLDRIISEGSTKSEIFNIASIIEKSIIESMNQPGYAMSPRFMRRISRLPEASMVVKGMNKLILSWVNAEDKNKRGFTLDCVLEYILGWTCLYTAEGKTQLPENMVAMVDACLTMLKNFESMIDTHLSRNNYGYDGDNNKDQYAWEATVGLKSLFRPPDEPLDIFIVDKLPMLKHYFRLKGYAESSQMPDSATSLYQIKRYLHVLNAEFTALELTMTRGNHSREAGKLEKWATHIGGLNQQINRCLLAVEMATPALPNTYLPKLHVQRLVNSALRRFARE